MALNDHSYLQQAFMLSPSGSQEIISDNRRVSIARNKFTDTTPGGNFWINPPPQWAPTCDIRVSRYWKDQFSGMGADYSNAIDDNADVIYCRMGVPEFNGLFTFLSNMFDASTAYLARTGRAPGWIFKAFELFGSVIAWPLQAISVTYTTVRWMMGIPKNRFYYSKNAMPLFWKASTGMLNSLMLKMNIIPPAFRTRQDQVQENSYDFSSYTPGERKELANLLPGLWKADGSVDLFYLANRATRKHIRWQKALKERIENGAVNNQVQAVDAMYKHANEWNDPAGESSNSNINSYLETYFNAGLGAAGDPNTPESAGSYEVDSSGVSPTTPRDETGAITQVTDIETKKGFFQSIQDHLEAELRDGGGFLGLKVNHNGSISESFSNSTKDNPLEGILNSASQAAQDARMTMSGGKTGLPLVDDAIEMATSAVQGLASGTMLSGVVSTLMGQGFIEIPKMWADSSANLPRETYTIQLRSPSAHPVSRVQNLIIPFVCIMNMGLAHSAGAQSYTSPFLVELYSKGRTQTRLGIVDNLGVTRGVGNVGWSRDKHPLGMDLTFGVVDLSPCMHMPIDPALAMSDFTNPSAVAQKIFVDDNNYSDYLSSVASVSLSEQIYSSQKLAKVLAKTQMDVKQWVSPTQMAANFSQTLSMQFVSAFMQGTMRTN